MYLDEHMLGMYPVHHLSLVKSLLGSNRSYDSALTRKSLDDSCRSTGQAEFDRMLVRSRKNLTGCISGVPTLELCQRAMSFSFTLNLILYRGRS